MIVDLDELKEQVNQTLDIDDDLLERKIDAAQSHLEAMLGFKIDAVNFPDTETVAFPNTVPASLKEAVLQLAAYWYAQRESVLIGTNAQIVPMGVADIVANHRNYSWGADE